MVSHDTIRIRKFSGKPFITGELEVDVQPKEYLNPFSGAAAYCVSYDNNNQPNTFINTSQVFEVNKDGTLTEIEQAYVNRLAEEENMKFKKFAAIFRLRYNNEHRYKTNCVAQSHRDKPISIGDKVWVTVKLNNNIEKIGGIVQNITIVNKTKHICAHKTYDVSSGTINFKAIKDHFYITKSGNHSCGHEFITGGVSSRSTEDLSNIYIPESLTKIATNRLLKIFKERGSRRWDTDRDLRINNVMYSAIQIKAELNNREDIPNKNIKRYKGKN